MSRLKFFYCFLKLLLDMTKRDLCMRYAGSYLGFLWTLILPLIMSLVNVFVFSILMRGRMGFNYENVPFAVFYFSGFVIWIFFSDSLMRSTTIIKDNSSLVTKISFPIEVLPLMGVASSLITHIVILILTILLLLLLGVGFSNYIFFMPLYFILSLMMIIGLVYFISAINVFIPDLGQIVSIGLNILFYLTPILYPIDIIKNNAPDLIAKILIEYNPWSLMVEGYRRCIIVNSLGIDYKGMLLLLFFDIICLLIGMLTFKLLKKSFADVL